jgi:hypothetical protein
MSSYEILEEYVESQRAAIDMGTPVTVEVRDTDSFERLVVKALLGPPERPIPGADRLILKNLAENVSSDAWTIKILEELDVEAVSIKPQSQFRKSSSEG